MDSLEFQTSIVIIIKSSEPIDVISEKMGISPTKVSQNQNAADSNANNLWAYKKRFIDGTNFSVCLQSFLEEIPFLSQKIAMIKQYGSCTLRVSIVSLFAQIGFSISNSDLQTLSSLDIPFEITLFSYGNCIDDEKAEKTGDGSLS